MSFPSGRQRGSMEKDQYYFVEHPSQDFFCPVSLELLLEPQLTSCCGHHLLLEAATRLQSEGKACPMCNGERWNAFLDKYHRRKVHEVRVRCRYEDNGCDWKGEVHELKGHLDSCVKGLWECRYCAFRCTFGEGEGKHLATCPKFPKPCPNGCEVGSVERCNMEQHLSVCPLEPVACEMKEFGCSVVVPRKELATHMRESELQHLTVMTMTNLSLTRQLQQESKERDEKIAQLLKESKERDAGIARIELKFALMNYDILELKNRVSSQAADVNVSCSGIAHFTFEDYLTNSSNGDCYVTSRPVYTHHHGYKFNLQIYFYATDIGAQLYLMAGEYDRELEWPVEVKVRLKLHNQADDHHHVVRTKHIRWPYYKRESAQVIDSYIIKYSTLERCGGSVQYMMNDCLEFNILVDVLSHICTFSIFYHFPRMRTLQRPTWHWWPSAMMQLQESDSAEN